MRKNQGRYSILRWAYVWVLFHKKGVFVSLEVDFPPKRNRLLFLKIVPTSWFYLVTAAILGVELSLLIDKRASVLVGVDEV